MSNFNACPVYDVMYMADREAFSIRLHFKDQAQATEAVRTIRTAGSALRTIIHTRYGETVIDLTPGVFLGLYPHFNNQPVNFTSFRASDAPDADDAVTEADCPDDISADECQHWMETERDARRQRAYEAGGRAN